METPALTQELTTLLSDLLLKKPTTKGDALLLLQMIEMRIASWIVSELPSVDQKIVLGVRGLVKEVSTSSCFSRR